MMEYGLQLYSVRDFAQKDLAQTLEKVAGIGYKFVEFAGFFGHSAQEVKAMLDGTGLRVSGTHSSLDRLVQDFGGTVDYHHAIGNSNYIIPGAPVGTSEELKHTIDMLNKFQPMLAAEGITLGYHNHHREFMPNQDGQLAAVEMWNNTDIQFEVDTYWVFVAGKDPLKVLEEMKDRVRIIHLKDGDREMHGCSLGAGEAPVAAVRQKAIELGLTMVVESEGLQPDGISEVTRCFDYLMTLEK